MKFISLKEIMIAINFWSWSSLRKLFDRSGRKIKFSSKIPTLAPKLPAPGHSEAKILHFKHNLTSLLIFRNAKFEKPLYNNMMMLHITAECDGKVALQQ